MVKTGVTSFKTGEPRVCIEKTLSPQLVLDAAERAIGEDPQNASVGQVVVERRFGLEPSAAEKFGALLTGKRWKNGRTLRVRHLDGLPVIHAKVESFARLWEQFANLKLEFVARGGADIRISYQLDGQSWSYVGTDALSISEPELTMHFGWLTPHTDDVEVRRAVTHEFGHALGMIHEHLHPMHKINWDRQAVYDYYIKRLKWTKALVDFNLFAAQSRWDTQFNEYDPASIMHYPIPAEFTIDRRPVGWNTDISSSDKIFISQIYPKIAPKAAMSMPDLETLKAAAAPGMITRRWG
jgi:hypothetical protein